MRPVDPSFKATVISLVPAVSRMLEAGTQQFIDARKAGNRHAQIAACRKMSHARALLLRLQVDGYQIKL